MAGGVADVFGAAGAGEKERRPRGSRWVDRRACGRLGQRLVGIELLDLVFDFETFSVFTREEGIGLIGGGSSGEGFFFGVDVEYGADFEAGVVGIDAVGGDIFVEFGEEFVPLFEVFSDGEFLALFVVGADAEGDIGEVAPGAGVVDLFDFAVEGGTIACSDGVDEVTGMSFAAVALELFEAFAVVVVGPAAAACAGVVSIFELDDVTAADSADVGFLFDAGLEGQVGEPEDDWDDTGVEVDEMDVRGFAGVVPGDASASGEDFEGEGALIREHVADVVEDMYAPVAHFAAAGIPDPVPVVVEVFAVHRLVLGGSEPEVVVDGGWGLDGVGDFSDGFAHSDAVAPDPLHFAEFLGLNEFLDFGLHGVGALLCAALDDAVVFSGGLDDSAAFEDGL